MLMFGLIFSGPLLTQVHVEEIEDDPEHGRPQAVAQPANARYQSLKFLKFLSKGSLKVSSFFFFFFNKFFKILF